MGKLILRNRKVKFPRPPMIMGIVNVNDDSFSGDGTTDPHRAVKQAVEMVNAGAEIIDVGAESARTDRAVISVDEETDRLSAFIALFNRTLNGQAFLSVNTWRPEVVQRILPLGVDILNDIGGLEDPTNASLCATTGTALLIMHTVGRPKIAHVDQRYTDVWDSLEAFFEERILRAVAAGLSEEHLIVDPGIDFAKQQNDNLKTYSGLERLARFDRPVLLPVSRKTVIGEVLQIDDPAARDAGTVACIVSGWMRQSAIFRVHNVPAAVATVRTLEAVSDGRVLAPPD